MTAPTLVAEAPSAKLRACGEIIARYGSRERVERAQHVVEQPRGVLTGPAAVEKLAAWQQQPDSLAAQITERRQQREQLAKQGYI